MVKVRDGESLESALKRFKKKIEAEGILKEWKERQYYLKPSTRKRLKKKEAIRKYQLKQAKKDSGEISSTRGRRPRKSSRR